MPCTAKRVSSTELELTGLVIWMADSAKREWVEPLFATIRISDASPVALDYKLFFGNAELGLGKRSYGSSQDFPQVPVAAWVFEFDSPRL
jgi:hypothetical protein